MKTAKYFLLRWACLLFIFSCHTEVKFGFRKKVKAGNHGMTEITCRMPAAPKRESIAIVTNKAGAITAGSNIEKKRGLVMAQNKAEIPAVIFSEKVIPESLEKSVRSSHPGKKSDSPEVNLFALSGFIMALVTVTSVIIAATVHIAPLTQNNDLFLISGLILVLSMITGGLTTKGLAQMADNPEEYKGKWLAVAGNVAGKFIFIIAIVFLVCLLIYVMLRFNVVAI